MDDAPLLRRLQERLRNGQIARRLVNQVSCAALLYFKWRHQLRVRSLILWLQDCRTCVSCRLEERLDRLPCIIIRLGVVLERRGDAARRITDTGLVDRLRVGARLKEVGGRICARPVPGLHVRLDEARA